MAEPSNNSQSAHSGAFYEDNPRYLRSMNATGGYCQGLRVYPATHHWKLGYWDVSMNKFVQGSCMYCGITNLQASALWEAARRRHGEDGV